jgi:phosphocarrier protein
MLKKEFTIVNKLGLHARAAAALVQLAGGFSSEITITRDDLTINCKSIMGVLMLAAAQNSIVALEIEGEDENEAMAALGRLIEEGFGELNE